MITLRTIGLAVTWTLGWAWALFAGVGGLILLVHEGPLPITNGWFANVLGHRSMPADGTTPKKPVRPEHLRLAAARRRVAHHVRGSRRSRRHTAPTVPSDAVRRYRDHGA
jgi:hypothetical protein